MCDFLSLSLSLFHSLSLLPHSLLPHSLSLTHAHTPRAHIHTHTHKHTDYPIHCTIVATRVPTNPDETAAKDAMKIQLRYVTIVLTSNHNRVCYAFYCITRLFHSLLLLPLAGRPFAVIIRTLRVQAAHTVVLVRRTTQFVCLLTDRRLADVVQSAG